MVIECLDVITVHLLTLIVCLEVFIDGYRVFTDGYSVFRGG